MTNHHRKTQSLIFMNRKRTYVTQGSNFILCLVARLKEKRERVDEDSFLLLSLHFSLPLTHTDKWKIKPLVQSKKQANLYI